MSVATAGSGVNVCTAVGANKRGTLLTNSHESLEVLVWKVVSFLGEDWANVAFIPFVNSLTMHLEKTGYF
jgi:hypothetical protein